MFYSFPTTHRLPLRPAATWRALSSTSNAHIGLAELFGGVVNKPKEGTVSTSWLGYIGWGEQASQPEDV